MVRKDIRYRKFYDEHPRFGARYCDLEKGQYGIGTDPFREFHFRCFTEEVIKSVSRHIKTFECNLLDVGCGQGHIISKIQKQFSEVIGIEISSLRIKQIYQNSKKKVSLVLCDAEEMPFREEAFDVIVATEIIEHVPSDVKTLREIYTALKPGGVLVLTTPIAYTFEGIAFLAFSLLKGRLTRLSGEFPERFLEDEHIRSFNYFLLKNRLKKMGFKIMQIGGIGFRFPPKLTKLLTKFPLSPLIMKESALFGRLFPFFSWTLIAVATI